MGGKVTKKWQENGLNLVEVRRLWPDLLRAMARKPLLYVPLSKGGDPRQIVTARVRQRIIIRDGANRTCGRPD